MMLRPYQQKTIDDLYSWLKKNDGNPCIELPTGAGKSHIIAAICKDVIQNYPETRILMLTHVKELIEQNAEKMRGHWQNAPMGIYSASLNKRDLSQPITFAGVQSVRKKAYDIGHVDLIIIDECHLVNNADSGVYREIIATLQSINEYIRVIGLTATPYRLGHGLITDKPAIFDDIIKPVSIEELITQGYLSILRSKITSLKLSTEGVKKRGGEYIEAELQKAVNTDDQNLAVVKETIERAGDRKHWLFFCAGVAHAEQVAECLNNNGIISECVTGSTTAIKRASILSDFKKGRIKAVTNANVLTTGFDFPDIDLIVMMRPTMSPALYVQMAGRGLRPKSHTDHCLILDYAGVIETHGPITNVVPPTTGKKSDSEGEAPVKICPECSELVHISVSICPACDYNFPPKEKKDLVLRDDDILGIEGKTMGVRAWIWSKHVSKSSGIEMLAVTYFGQLLDPPVKEYLPINHAGTAGIIAHKKICTMILNTNTDISNNNIKEIKTIEELLPIVKKIPPPSEIEYLKTGNFYRVLNRTWSQHDY